MKQSIRLSRTLPIVMLLGLTACGGGSDTAMRNAGPIGGESGEELAATQVLHIGNGTEVQTLDPHRGEETSGANVQRDLFEGLISEAPNGDLIPGVAESWEISDDGKTYTFHLRGDARWSNGDPVTSEDFVYSLRRSIDPATLSRYTFILSPIVNADAIAAGKLPPEELGVRSLDPSTLEITLTHPTPYFLGLLTHSTTYPVHRASVEAHGDQFTRPGNLVGNGAYQLDQWVVQSHIKLVRNPYYWDDENTVIDEVWFYPTEDSNAELQRFRAGELDMTESVPNAQLGWVRANMPERLKISPYLGIYYYGLNLTRPPFKDNPKLRRALALAIDRDIITKQILAAGQLPAYGWVPPVTGYTGQQMAEASWTQAERVAEAKRLYAEAGYSAANPLRTEIMYNTDEDHRRIAIAVAAMWREVLGVQASILNQEWKVFLETRRQGIDTQVFRSGWIGDYNDAFTFAELMRSTSGLSDTGWANAEYDRLLDASQMESDPEKRARLLEQAERLLLEDMPIIPIYFYVKARLVQPWVGGYEGNIMDHHRRKDFYVLAH